MSGRSWRRVKSVLAKALALPKSEREPWLERHLAEEPELQAEVRSLIAAYDTDGSLLEPPPADDGRLTAAWAVAGTLEPGARLGVYRVIREIGRGGMGIVFLAERNDDSFERRVALKLIQHDTPQEELQRRFLRERRILARLDHPGIARLLDGGATQDGRPYLVMEYVEGEPIDAFCRDHGLDLDARLDLFLHICSAVDFAHRNLVVHRDLKPSNVLVGVDGEPKLLDFGIATLLDDEPTGPLEPLSRTASRVMTPEYASPEQIRGEPITTATDVYALGVMLYLLLVGRRPYELRNLGLSEIVRVVCEEDPLLPSTAVRTLSDGNAASVTAEPVERRRPAATGRELQGDLDAIVMKALRKEPGERYRSAEELADDLRRYREGLPVLARRGTFAYRTGKLVRRHRLAVAVAGAFLLVLVAFALSMALQVARTTAALARAKQEAAKAAAVQSFLEETLAVADPEKSEGHQATVQEALDRARDRLETSFSEQPEIAAAVQRLIGKLYSNLGSYDDAEPLLRQALATRRRLLPPVTEEVAETLESLGLLLGRSGRANEAEPLLQEALSSRLELHGRWRLEVAKDLDLLAHVASAQGNPLRAADLERQALEVYRKVLGESDPEVAHALSTIAGFERAGGHLDTAETALHQAIGVLDGLADPPLMLRGELAGDLGELLEELGRYEEAEQAYRRGLDTHRQVFGDEHHWVAHALVRLGVCLSRQGRSTEAEERLREGVAMLRRVLDPEHPELAIALNNLAFMLAERGDLEEAEEHLETVLSMQRKSIPDHPVVGVTLRNLGLLEMRQGRPAEARPHLEEALALHRRHYGEDHYRTALSRLALGWSIGALGHRPQAVAMQRQALAGLEQTYEPGHPRVAWARAMLGESLVGLGRLDEAEAFLLSALPVLEQAHGASNHRVVRALEALVELSEAQGRAGEAAAYGALLAAAKKTPAEP